MPSLTQVASDVAKSRPPRGFLYVSYQAIRELARVVHDHATGGRSALGAARTPIYWQF